MYLFYLVLSSQPSSWHKIISSWIFVAQNYHYIMLNFERWLKSHKKRELEDASTTFLVNNILPNLIRRSTRKQSSRGVLRKRCSGNMLQIYRSTPMSRCDFNKIAKQLLLVKQLFLLPIGQDFSFLLVKAGNWCKRCSSRPDFKFQVKTFTKGGLDIKNSTFA